MEGFSKLNSTSPIRDIILLSVSAGKLMLENGAETYRVEDTIEIICKSKGVTKVQTFVIPTGIFMSVDHNGEIYTFIERVFSTNINLQTITKVNELSRSFVSSNLSISECSRQLEEIRQDEGVPLKLKYLGAGVASSFFTLLLGGGSFEFIMSFLLGMLVQWVLEKSGEIFPSFFMKYIGGGLVVATLSFSASELASLANIAVDPNQIIVGVIMLLVPGVQITNAVRDTISGDYVAGMSRATEAIMIATAIAIGVGIVLNVYYSIAGGF